MVGTCRMGWFFGGLFAAMIGLFADGVAAADFSDSSFAMNESSYGVPMTITNFTMPGFLVLSAVPHTALPMTRGRLAVMVQVSAVNYFQVSPEVESYLAATRGDVPRALTPEDVDYIVHLPEGQGFYIDGEIHFANVFLVYGVTDTIDVALRLSAADYTGGYMDDLIYGFHDTCGIGQQGRQYVPDDQFQYVFGANGDLFTSCLDEPDSNGLLDPQIFFRFAFPWHDSPWSASMAVGVKPPINGSDNLISTERWDFGVFTALQRRWNRHTFVLNAALVYPGKIIAEDRDDASYNRPLMPSVNLSWLYRFKRWRPGEFFAQAMYAEHPLRELVKSEFTDFDFQLTIGIKWHTPQGVFSFGFTENLFNMDNTPDFGLHISWDAYF
ncbi:DUF3187 family protein [bacterium]|nr:DUF3187 family protein [candidate division CSSED10-310 bacterium]